jgi:hypothetical protein
MATEQQDRFPEHLGATRGELVGTTRHRNELNQAPRGLASLFRSRLTHIARRGRHRAKPPTELRGHRGPTMQERALRGVARRPARTVAIQPLEVEHPRSESKHPDLDGA